ncbi:MAG: hypothetical protein HY800_01935 [Ignavibacteriales bacterium]|nr:hypothetical protein [Ignavibacteriales bacterium]
MKKMILFLLLFGQFAFAQQRVLVSPNGDVIRIKKGVSIKTAAEKLMRRAPSSISGECTNEFNFGFPVNVYDATIAHVGYHKDVMGQWFVAKASGTIDTVFWYNNWSEIGAKDSLVYVRIHESFIGPNYGPGIRPGPFPPPCQSWGYWKTTNDADNGVGAFIDDLSPTEDTTWYSTIRDTNNSLPDTRPPFGLELFGQGVGLGITHRPGLNQANIEGTGLSPNIIKDDVFFVSFRIHSDNEHKVNDLPTGFASWDGGITTTSDENYPSRNWKFYEHDSGPSNCAGDKRENVKRGWVARGNFNSDDTLGVAAINIWYSMTVTTNVPPIINSVEGGEPHNTFSTANQIITYEIWDCDPESLLRAGVATAIIRWSKATTIAGSETFVDQADISMSPTGEGYLYPGEIPGQPAGTTVNYRVVATDLRGMQQLGPSRGYKIVTLKNNFYRVDTNYACTHLNISGSGTVIDTSKLFNPGNPPAYRDDGTAGWYDIGGDMQFFGDTVRYAWVGINGAIALSKSATDTIDVNSAGYATIYWDFPMLQHHYRADTNYPTRMPPNFIAGFWADMILADTGAGAAQFGKIMYGNDGNACKFIVEWDSVGTFDQETGDPLNDITTFRIILNHCDGTIEYQYDNVGTRGLDSVALLGMQADSTYLTTGGGTVDPGFVFVNRNIYPYESKPRNDWCIKFYPGAPVYISAGWNMLSVANDRQGDWSKSSVYPDAVSEAFKYQGSYVIAPTLENGPGYWLKYGTYAYAGAPGLQKTSLVINVSSGWNMIGTMSKPIATADIVKSPGLTVGSYYKYEGTYKTVTTLTPGRGYWVKTNQAGTLTMTASPEELPKIAEADYSEINKVTIQDKYGRYQTLYIGADELVSAAGLDAGEWPPAAPEFDARFKNSQGMVATSPSKLEAGAKYEYPISIGTEAYPITVRWEISKPAERKLTLVSGSKMLAVLEGSGSVKIKNAAGLGIALGSDVSVPKKFALGQNYPNPFNPSTHFTVDVPKISSVEVVVYDVH